MNKSSSIGPSPAIGAQAFVKLSEQLQQVKARLAEEESKRKYAEKKLLVQEAGAKLDIEKGITKQVKLSSDLQCCIAETQSLKSQVDALSDTTGKSAIENLTQQITSEIEEKKKLLAEHEGLRHTNFNLAQEVDRLKKDAEESESYRISMKEDIRKAEEDVKRANAAHSPEWMRQKMVGYAIEAKAGEARIKRLEEEIASLAKVKQESDLAKGDGKDRKIATAGTSDEVEDDRVKDDREDSKIVTAETSDEVEKAVKDQQLAIGELKRLQL